MLAKTGVCVDGAMGALPDVDCGGAEHVAWATAGLIACVLLVALTMRFARVDFDLKRIEATSLLSASGDALVHDGDNEIKTPLTSKSISYDVVKLQVKTGLTLAKLYVAGLGLTEEASAFGLALVVLLGGVVLLIIGLRFDQYYAELKGSVGEGPNHSNHSNHSNSFKIRFFFLKIQKFQKISTFSNLSAKFRQNFIKI